MPSRPADEIPGLFIARAQRNLVEMIADMGGAAEQAGECFDLARPAAVLAEHAVIEESIDGQTGGRHTRFELVLPVLGRAV